LPQPDTQPQPDFQRFITVFHADRSGTAPATFNPHATLAEVAHALADNEIADCPVVCILESVPSEGTCRDVTEDIARLIPAVIEEASRDGWEVRACAIDLMERYGIDQPEADADDEGEAMQVGFDRERDRRAMAEAV